MTTYYDDANSSEVANIVQAWVNAGATPPDVNRRYSIDHFISRLKAASAFNGIIVVPYCNDYRAALINWVTPNTADASLQGDPSGSQFISDAGYKMNGSATPSGNPPGYLKLGAALTAIPGIAQDSVEVDYVVYGATSTSFELGGESGARIVSLAPKLSGGSVDGRIDNTSNIIFGANANRNGMMSLTRSYSTGFSFHVNGAPLNPDVNPVAAPSVPLNGQVLTLGRDLAVYADGLYQFWRVGPPVPDRIALYNAFTNYEYYIHNPTVKDNLFFYTLMQADGTYPATAMFNLADGSSAQVKIAEFPSDTSGMNMRYAIRQSADGKATCYSTKNTIYDNQPGDPSTKRRSEIAVADKMHPGVVYRGAYTVQLFAWPGAEMALGQAHSPKVDNRSPTWAFRRLASKDGGYAVITTRVLDPNNPDTPSIVIWQGPADAGWWGTFHDIVFEVCYSTPGYIKVWLDGEALTFTNGSNTFSWNNSFIEDDTGFEGPGNIEDQYNYWKEGIYAGEGLGNDPTTQVYAVYGNQIFHSATWNATSRIAYPLTLPSFSLS